MRIDVPAIIDIEASGFGQGSYPIEIGYALEDRVAHNFLIQPAAGWTHWSEEAEEIHGLSYQWLKENGMALKEVAYQLNHALEGKTLYSDAWGFDNSWLGRLFEEAELIQRFRLETINKLLTEKQMDAWHKIKEQVWEEQGNERRHRASCDVKVLQETFERVLALP